MACLRACRRAPRAFQLRGWQILRASSTATKAAPSTKTQTPEHSAAPKAHINTAHHAIGTASAVTFHLKPEIREAQFLKIVRELSPKFIASVPGVWGLPGPRSLTVQDDETKLFTGIYFWESKEALHNFEKSEEHQKMMHDIGAFFDIKSITQEVHSSDFHYWAPIKPCNLEKYPVVVGTFKVKPGFRKVCQKLVTSNPETARWADSIGLLFQVMTYNEAEDEVVAYSVYKDLLKYSESLTHMEKNLADWGLAEYIVFPHPDEAAHGAHKAAAHFDDGHKIYSNCWVYSE